MTTFAISQLDEPDFVAWLASLHPAQTCAISQTPHQGPIPWFLTTEHDLEEGQDLYIARQAPAEPWGIYLWERDEAARLCDLPEWAVRVEQIADSFSPAQLPVPAAWLLDRLTEDQARWHPKKAAATGSRARSRTKAVSIALSASPPGRKFRPGESLRRRGRAVKSASKRSLRRP